MEYPHLVGAKMGAEKAVLEQIKAAERFPSMSETVRFVIREFARARGLWPPNGDGQKEQQPCVETV